MAYFEDGTPYVYLDESDERDLVNIGWLESSRPYPTGPVPDGFVDRLAELCRQPVARTRGFHVCSFCESESGELRKAPNMTVVQHPEGEVHVGNAEVRVESPSGVKMAAPDMVLHYVIEHGYKPPVEFVEAVMHGSRLEQ